MKGQTYRPSRLAVVAIAIVGTYFALNYFFAITTHLTEADRNLINVDDTKSVIHEYHYTPTATREDREPLVNHGFDILNDSLQSEDSIQKSDQDDEHSFNQSTERIPTKDDVAQPLSFSHTRTPNSLTSWTPPKLPENLQHVHQTDPNLIAHIRDFWILSPFEGPINVSPDKLPKPGHRDLDHSEQGQPTLVNKLLKNKTTGFFIECGAADGTFNSNSLMFETYHNWDGILIEGNPKYFSSVLDKKRRSFMLNACLSVTETPQVVNFTTTGIAGGISEYISPGQWDYIESSYKDLEIVVVQCFPIYSILAALGVKHVEYFSLDIEGPELEVLKTVPLNETIIDVISIEKRVWGDVNATEQKIEDLKNLLFPYGYHVVDILELDIIFSRLS
ncbi:hypothetical protein LSH36_269g08057 [Paralvinella palmiformis]|uniref:Methyltransferase FkbM domain-containing protein n=1 Tax=Paralvinella palmiformis TaxID=53620 RepID=A0AAD9JLV0_9ANNE|nr:hypothetical protein LSH36_269g08057 [Paralvinella palmiformis]